MEVGLTWGRKMRLSFFLLQPFRRTPLMIDMVSRGFYSTDMMRVRQQTNGTGMIRRATGRQRRIAGLIAAGIVILFGSLWLLQRLHFDFGLLFGPCGMKQRTGLPCPTCGMSTSVLAFSRGDLLTAFYVQPAAAFLCCLLVVAAFFASLVSVFGVYVTLLDRLWAEIGLGRLVVGLLIILAAGWAVTFARALAARP